MSNKIGLAKEFCKHYHEGEFRKGDNQPFHTHPFAVVGILRKYGHDDWITQCIAYLHDTVEETSARMNEIRERFGYEVSNGVYILSRNKGKVRNGQKLNKEEYKLRLSFARNKIKRVKLADMIHNTKDLSSLKQKSIDTKIKDSEEFYIPMGKEIAPIMIKELIDNIENYRIKIAMF